MLCQHFTQNSCLLGIAEDVAFLQGLSIGSRDAGENDLTAVHAGVSAGQPGIALRIAEEGPFCQSTIGGIQIVDHFQTAAIRAAPCLDSQNPRSGGGHQLLRGEPVVDPVCQIQGGNLGAVQNQAADDTGLEQPQAR